MEYETLLVDRVDNIATVTLNRPAKLNAVNERMIGELIQLFTELRDDTITRFVIFTGAKRAFSAGADLKTLEFMSKDLKAIRMGQLLGHDLMRTLENLEQITIAAVNGPAMGAGLALAMACDFRIASKDAFFTIPEAAIGILFIWGCIPRLVRLIGPAKAKELIMTADSVDAKEALAIGLVSKVVPPDQLIQVAHELARKISSRAPLAVRMAKKIVNATSPANLGDLYLCEPEIVERLCFSQDFLEGVKALEEKREPQFTGM